jgi:two-component system nitrogen regulation response regulator GlnG
LSRKEPTILVVDDLKEIRWLLSNIMKQAGYTPVEAGTGEEALRAIGQQPPSAILLDLRMPGAEGMEVLKELKKQNLDIPVIIITAYGELRSAVEAVKLGAYDYLTKPFDNEDVLLTVKRAIEEHSMKEEIANLRTCLKETTSLAEILGTSDEIKRVFQQINCVAQTDFTVVLYGETGSGKELVARTIHRQSLRREGNFVVVDCGSIPETLLESELFGHEKGAFTGAHVTKEGQFELASGGTLLLDEIGNLPLSMQSKLLRVLQEKSIHRVGGKKDIKVDIRVIAAGNERLEDMVALGRFRRDLYHRLNEFTIEIPPLRKRKDDIVLLSKHFLDVTNKELNKTVKGFSEEALDLLLQYHWPGNVRELKNVIRRAVLLADDLVEARYLGVICKGGSLLLPEVQPRLNGSTEAEAFSLKNITKKAMEEVERRLITQVLQRTGGNKSKAAKILRIDYATLHYKVKRYGLSYLALATDKEEGQALENPLPG